MYIIIRLHNRAANTVPQTNQQNQQSEFNSIFSLRVECDVMLKWVHQGTLSWASNLCLSSSYFCFQDLF